jgi:hypothetical protein
MARAVLLPAPHPHGVMTTDAGRTTLNMTSTRRPALRGEPMDWFWQAVLLLMFTVPVIVLFAYAVYDVLRRQDAGLAVRAIWLIVFCVVPILGPLVYLVVRPPGTTAQQRAGTEGTLSQAEELTALADLHDRGKLTDHEYQQAKAQHVGVDLSQAPVGSVRETRAHPLV